VLDYPNGGAAAARNRGLDAARGEYVGFVDSDDWIEPTMYEELHQAMESASADIVECGAWYIPEDGAPVSKRELPARRMDGAEECVVDFLDWKNNFQCVWNKLYRRSVIGEIRFPDYSLGEDAVFNGEVICGCRCKVVLDRCLYYYLIRSGGLGHSVRPGTELHGTRALSRIYDRLLPFSEKHGGQLARHICDLALSRLDEDMSRKPENWRAIRRELKKTYCKYYKKIHVGRTVTARQQLGYRLFCLSPELYMGYSRKRDMSL
jgi:glycosyltransferase involved in cell wall biosynthesis